MLGASSAKVDESATTNRIASRSVERPELVELLDMSAHQNMETGCRFSHEDEDEPHKSADRIARTACIQRKQARTAGESKSCSDASNAVLGVLVAVVNLCPTFRPSSWCSVAGVDKSTSSPPLVEGTSKPGAGVQVPTNRRRGPVTE